MKIGVAGTGRMGTAVARRLLALGHDVHVWNRTPAHAGEALAAGAAWCESAAELAEQSETVITFLYDDDAVEEVYFGTRGLLAGDVEDRLFIDMGTVSPESPARIAAAMEDCHASFVECPVSGSTPQARSGALVGFAGGSPTAFSRAQPVLSVLCRRVELVGLPGAGARLKLAANLLLAVFYQALGEALLLADPPAEQRARVLALLADSNIGAALLRSRGDEIVATLDGARPATATFDVDALRKDLRYMAAEAESRNRELPLASRTLECLDRAARAGNGRLDAVAYPAYWIAAQEAA
jgi:3-hydroxyisobutyrate dehydrogenase